ncbi:hypothetical protein [Microbacterium sp.]|uniref:hypothetical protein n=1 Tax=Microbacterium sp. TaxID=51671 RepID=UPI002811DE54|nr:hypothetical protein [Microbacterium sp.]
MTDPSPAPVMAHRLTSFAIGVGGGALGLLPWLMGGGRLPLQNLWSSATMPEDMPFVLLPLSQYYATVLFSLVLLGGTFAGIGLRFARRRRALAVWPAVLGLAAVHLVAAIQSFGVLADGLGLAGGGDSRAGLYFAGMLAGAVVAMLLAQLALWMTSRLSPGTAALGVALSAVPFASWFARGVVAFTSEVTPPMFLSSIVSWLPAVIVGAALIWCGVRPARRLAVWLVSLLALWIVPALFTAIQYGLGMRVLQGDVGEMAAAAADVFPMALREIWMPTAVALAIAVAGTVVRAIVERGGNGAPQEDAPAGEDRSSTLTA